MTRLGLYIAIILASFAIAMDFASIDLALPALERDFQLDLSQVQWVINAYLLAIAIFMVPGGKLADAHGRRRVFLIGSVLFLLGSLIAGAAWNNASLIAFRVLQGIGGALLWPAMIGMACAAAGDARRPFVMGLIFGTCSLGNAAGPLVGAALTEWFSWRWVLWINVPMTLLAVGCTLVAVPSDASTSGRARPDFGGMITLSGGLLGLMLLIYRAPAWGWTSPAAIALGAASLALFATFRWIESRAADPLVEPALLRNRELRALALAVIVIRELFFLVLLFYTQFAMKFLGDDPVSAGARMVPFMIIYGIVAFLNGRLTALLGARPLLLTGLACGALAAGTLAAIGFGAPSWLLLAVLAVLGASVGIVLPSASARGIAVVGGNRAALAMGIMSMSQLAGSAALLVVNTAIFSAIGQANLAHQFATENRTVSAQDQIVIDHLLSGPATLHSVPIHTVDDIPHIATAVRTAFESGFSVVMVLSALSAAAVFLLLLRKGNPATSNVSES